jgi:hypothetical protein
MGRDKFSCDAVSSLSVDPQKTSTGWQHGGLIGTSGWPVPHTAQRTWISLGWGQLDWGLTVSWQQWTLPSLGTSFRLPCGLWPVSMNVAVSL